MLHVPLGKLPRRAAQQVFAYQARLGVNERRHILQLVAETKCASGLIERVPAPQATRQHLIEEPTIRQQVERLVRRFDLDGAERVRPVDVDCGERVPCGGGATIAPYERSRRVVARGSAEQEYDGADLIGGQIDFGTQRCARIESGPCRARKVLLAHRRRTAHRAVASDERRAVATNGPRRAVDVEESDAPGERRVISIAREQRAGVGVDAGFHVHRSSGPQIAQHPFDVTGDREPACAARAIGKLKDCELDRRVDRHVDAQFGFDSVFQVLEHAVAKAVAGHVR